MISYLSAYHPCGQRQSNKIKEIDLIKLENLEIGMAVEVNTSPSLWRPGVVKEICPLSDYPGALQIIMVQQEFYDGTSEVCPKTLEELREQK